MRTFRDLDDFASHVGEHLGYSPWHIVDQHQIDLFARATGDHQWIHVDPERAGAGPFGTTIAHGYLTLSLVPGFVATVYRIDGLAMTINYGSDKVRFPSAVPVDSRIRAGVELIAVERYDTHAQAHLRVTVERDGNPKPVCVAETVSRFVPAFRSPVNDKARTRS